MRREKRASFPCRVFIMALYPRQNLTFAFHICFPLFYLCCPWFSIEVPQIIQHQSSIMRHWIFATRCVFTIATHIHSCPAIQHIWVAFYVSWFHLFNFFQHAWMIYTSKGRALYPDVCRLKLINIVPFQEATQRLTSNVPGSRPGPFSKCQRLNKPCWLFDKAPKMVLEENYSWLPITRTLEFWRG